MTPPQHRFSFRHYRQTLLTLLILIACAFPPNIRADFHEHKLNKIKSAILFNIAKFVRWPDDALAENPDFLTVCHYRENILYSTFQAIVGKKAQQRTVNDKLVNSLDTANQCAMLFIPLNQLSIFIEDQAHHGPLPILTVADLTETDSVSPSDSRAAVNLIRRGARIGLDIDLPEVTRNGLIISSELLKLAQIRR